MAHFYGTIRRNAAFDSYNGKEVTKTGTCNSGLVTTCASKEGAIRCHAYHKDGKDMVRVEMTKWQGMGEYRVLYDGPIGEYESEGEESTA